MSQGRPLHAVFAELLGDDVARQAYAADPSSPLDDAGHGDLPSDLVAEAIVSFADTAPPAVAEHLAPFVMAHSVVPAADDEPPAASAGLDLLATAPADIVERPDVDASDSEPDQTALTPELSADAEPRADDLDFGGGALDATSEEGASAGMPDDVPWLGSDALDVPIEQFPGLDMLPADAEPEVDGADDGDEGLPE